MLVKEQRRIDNYFPPPVALQISLSVQENSQTIKKGKQLSNLICFLHTTNMDVFEIQNMNKALSVDQ